MFVVGSCDWPMTNLCTSTFPVAGSSLNCVSIKTGAMCRFNWVLEIKQQGAKIWQTEKSQKWRYATFPSNILWTNAVHMANKTR